MATNAIGLDQQQSKIVSEKLNVLLANLQVYYINARGFHWNITGEKFFELHAKFEELYNDVLLKVDEVAERILTLGHTPLHTFTDYLQLATVPEVKHLSGGKEAIQSVLDNVAILLNVERDAMRAAQEAGDEGTSALISDYIREQEKLVWMYSAYLK